MAPATFSIDRRYLERTVQGVEGLAVIPSYLRQFHDCMGERKKNGDKQNKKMM